MATAEDLVRAQARYRGEDPDAAWAAFSGGQQAAAPLAANAPPVEPVAATPTPAPSVDLSSMEQAASARLAQASAPYQAPAPAVSPQPVEQPAAVHPEHPAPAPTIDTSGLRDAVEVPFYQGIRNHYLGPDGSDAQGQVAPGAAPAPAVVPPTQIGRDAKGIDMVRAGVADADAATMRAQQTSADSIGRRDAAIDELGALNADRRKQLDEQFAADDAEVSAFRERNAKTMEQVDSMMAEAAKTEVKDRRTRGQMIGAVIASAFAGIGDAVNAMAGRNTSFQESVNTNIQAMVDRDLSMQREALKDKRNDAAQKLTELGIAQRTFKDEQAATEAARIARTEQYINSAKEVAMKIGNEDQRRQALLGIEELGYRNAKAKSELGLRLSSEERLGRRGGGGGGAGNKLANARIADLEAKEKDGTITVAEQAALDDHRVNKSRVKSSETAPAAGTTAEDIPGYKRTKEVSPAIVTEATKVSAAVTGLNNGLDQLDKLRDEYMNTSVWDTGKRTELSNRARQIIGNYADTASQLAGGGQAGEAAKEQAMKDIPDPTSWDLPFRVDPKDIYRGLNEQNRQTADAKMRSMGYEPEANPSGGGGGSTVGTMPEFNGQAAGPAPEQTPQAVAQVAKVRVRAPNGQVGYLDADKIDAAKKRGFEVLE